ncbi:MAG: nickel pincer cofactor biosynthesis protein LarB [Verrucomicrobia bacterium]|nr:nickel pincer cofactor biosynthesis protein LarB [Verrucomicrobiota bacterium]MCH8514165.1 nickel pincer cofactor biosynthesis protein LarB [Kiritimatiellia bacterium]
MGQDADLRLDFDRAKRLGFPEIVYGESKSVDQLQRSVARFQARQQGVLISRCAPEKAAALPDSGLYDAVARTWMLQPEPPPPLPGRVAVVSAGTSDAPVVREALNTLRFLGVNALDIQDVGVAAIYRLLERLADLAECDVIICVAGFEGALASVVAGQCPQPVIAVPTSVGYGVAQNGAAALHAMLASCANGLMVMNIDNGVGAALAARRILRLLSPSQPEPQTD